MVVSRTPAATIVPPDGGWGWVVVFACFMIHVIADGVTYTFGIFYYEFLKYFGESKGTTAWVASIMGGMTYCVGPLVSGLTNKYGCRAVTVAGAILAATGLVLSVFAPNVLCLYFTIGLCTGAGFGLMYLPSIVSVTCYFEKKRAFATGIAVCGSGMGTFALAPLTEYLVEQYGWKGAMLITAGLVLNCVVFGALFRPLEPQEPQVTTTTSALMKPEVNNTNGYVNTKEKYAVPLIQRQICDSDDENTTAQNGHTIYEENRELAMTKSLTIPDSFSSTPSTPLVENDSMSLYNIKPLNGYVCNNRLDQSLHLPSRTTHISPQRSSSIMTSTLLEKVGKVGLPFVRSSASLAQTSDELFQVKCNSQPLSGGILHRKDIFYSGSLQNIAKYRSHPNIWYSTVSYSEHHATRKKLFRCCPQEVLDAFSEMTDFSLLRNPIFLMFGISNFLTSIGFNVPYVYTKDRVEELNIAKNEDASFLLAIIGISNTVGRVILGYMSDRSCVNRLWVYSTSLIISGMATALSCYAMNYTLMATYCATFGVTTGAYVSLTSVILVDLLGLDKLTNAFGLLLLYQGVASLIGPPITGWLYDGLGSYDPGFYVSGVMIAASGLMLFLVPCVRKSSEENSSTDAKNLEDQNFKLAEVPA